MLSITHLIHASSPNFNYYLLAVVNVPLSKNGMEQVLIRPDRRMYEGRQSDDSDVWRISNQIQCVYMCGLSCKHSLECSRIHLSIIAYRSTAEWRTNLSDLCLCFVCEVKSKWKGCIKLKSPFNLEYLTSLKRTRNAEWSLQYIEWTDMVRHVELNANARRQQRRRRRLQRPPIFGGRLLIYFILFWSAGCAISFPFNGNQSREKRDPFSITYFDMIMCVSFLVLRSCLMCLFVYESLKW